MSKVRQTYKEKNSSFHEMDFPRRMSPRDKHENKIAMEKIYIFNHSLTQVSLNRNVNMPAMTDITSAGPLERSQESVEQKTLGSWNYWSAGYTRGTHTIIHFSMRSCNKLLIAKFSLRPSLYPQTKGFPNVSPTRGVLVFVLQYLSVL